MYKELKKIVLGCEICKKEVSAELEKGVTFERKHLVDTWLTLGETNGLEHHTILCSKECLEKYAIQSAESERKRILSLYKPK